MVRVVGLVGAMNRSGRSFFSVRSCSHPFTPLPLLVAPFRQVVFRRFLPGCRLANPAAPYRFVGARAQETERKIGKPAVSLGLSESPCPYDDESSIFSFHVTMPSLSPFRARFPSLFALYVFPRTVYVVINDAFSFWKIHVASSKGKCK